MAAFKAQLNGVLAAAEHKGIYLNNLLFKKPNALEPLNPGSDEGGLGPRLASLRARTPQRLQGVLRRACDDLGPRQLHRPRDTHDRTSPLAPASDALFALTLPPS